MVILQGLHESHQGTWLLCSGKILCHWMFKDPGIQVWLLSCCVWIGNIEVSGFTKALLMPHPHGNLVILGPTVFSKSTLRLLNMTGLNILDNCAERWQRKSRQWLTCRWLDGRSADRASGRGRHGLEWEQSSEAYASSRGWWKVCPHQKDLGQVMRGTLWGLNFKLGIPVLWRDWTES